MQVAWDLFRQLGARATIADVAHKAGMSSANVYRFFPSKQALVEEVCQSLLAELLKAARAAIDSPGKPSERIAAMMMTLHRLMRDQLTADFRAYEIVEEAVEQKWPPIVDYLTKCAAMLAEAIADGQAASEFGPGDPLQLGWMTLQSCVGHPRPDAHSFLHDHSPRCEAGGSNQFRPARARQSAAARAHPGDLSP